MDFQFYWNLIHRVALNYRILLETLFVHLYQLYISHIELSNILFDKRKPTKDEIKTYEEMMNFIQEQILYNLDIRIVHKWKQGDIVMPDMYKMCHAVSGGFDSKDRQFTGIWGYRYNDFNELEGRYV